MHMTLEANYAVQIVEYLAEKGEKTDAKTIAERTAIPERFLFKILRKLVAEGIAKSYKGAKGGYELAKNPEDITLREVIEAVEGPYILSRCQKSGYSCGRSSCRLHSVYDEISREVQEKLDSYNFADLCDVEAK